MSTSVKEYDAQRAKTLALYVLTRRRDLEVINLTDKADVGIDFIAKIAKPVVGQFVPSFGVKIMATSEPLDDEAQATRLANKWWRRVDMDVQVGLLPVLLLLFSVEDDRGFYGWILEPHVDHRAGAWMSLAEPLAMKKIDKHFLDGLVDQVVRWFAVVSETLMKQSPEKA